MGNECRCIMCKKQLIEGETWICPRCSYFIPRGVNILKKNVVEITIGGLVVSQGSRIIKACKAVLELAKL